MKINYYNQPDDVKLGNLLMGRLAESFDKAYIFAGFVKDSGIYLLLPSLQESPIKETVVALGLDSKNTSKDMLIKVLNSGAKLKIYMNNESEKIETRAYAFVKNGGDSYVYLSAAKLSEGGLLENSSLITEIIYGKDDAAELEKLIEKLNGESLFKEIGEEEIVKLAANGEIVARISERKIPRISEMYSGKEEVEIGVKEYDESLGSTTDFSNLEDVDIAIELPADGKVQVKNSLGEEVEQILKRAEKKLSGLIDSENAQSVSPKIVPKEKEVDYDHMSTFIFELQTGDASGIKIANGIAKNLNKFMDYPDRFHVENAEGKLSESAKATFEIFDNKTGNEATDKDCTISRKDKYLLFESEILKALGLQKGDIIRMLKKESGVYRVEIIRDGTDEHNIWANYCNLTAKGNLRKYGVI
ncbi:MAG: hypothetical protein IJ217_00365 [Clostridia bacterium]|nr:hypothetical protein [Clostridia bacterium]